LQKESHETLAFMQACSRCIFVQCAGDTAQEDVTMTVK